MEKYEAKKKLSKNYFYSYQCDKGEMPKPENLKGISVVFFDGYHPTGDMGWMEQETICHLTPGTTLPILVKIAAGFDLNGSESQASD